MAHSTTCACRDGFWRRFPLYPVSGTSRAGRKREVMMTLVPLVSLVGLLSVAQSPAALLAPDPGAAGPYAVGHTSFTTVDSSRDVTSPFGGRPVFVSVWYPADGEAITAESPEAVYPLDP